MLHRPASAGLRFCFCYGAFCIETIGFPYEPNVIRAPEKKEASLLLIDMMLLLRGFAAVTVSLEADQDPDEPVNHS